MRNSVLAGRSKKIEYDAGGTSIPADVLARIHRLERLLRQTYNLCLQDGQDFWGNCAKNKLACKIEAELKIRRKDHG